MSPPFRFEQPRSPYSVAIADMLRTQNDPAAHAAVQKGAIYGSALQEIGQSIGQIPQQQLQQKQQQTAAAINTEQLAELVQKRKDLEEIDAAYAQKGGREAILARLPGHLRPDAEKEFADLDAKHGAAVKLKGELEALQTEYFADMGVKVRARGYEPEAAILAIADAKLKYADDPRVLAQLQQVQTALLENPTPDTVKDLADQLIAASQTHVKADLDAKTAEATQAAAATTAKRLEESAAETARKNAADEAAKRIDQAETRRNNLATAARSGDNEPLIPVIGPDGQPTLVRRSQAEGMRPASTREQGRPVTSGDAGRLADFDTSLDELAVLNTTLTETKGSTGTSAAIGAGLPAWATDLTGWGTDAKKRQGVIDRVKQIIGKALEGGVLRKEDEIKYEKILPTIKDTSAVADSKLTGLQQALIERRSTLLENLDDAGYDVTRFEARAGTKAPATPPPSTPDLSGLPAGRGRQFRDGPFAGQTWTTGPNGQAVRLK